MKLSYPSASLAAIAAILSGAGSACAEVGVLPIAGGSVYVTVQGGYQLQNGPRTSAFGAAQSTPGPNVDGTAAVGSFSSPGFVAAKSVTAVPGSDQVVETTNSVSIQSSQSSGTAPNIATVNSNSVADAVGFTAAMVDALANGASAAADAEGGRQFGAKSAWSTGASVGYAFRHPVFHGFRRIEFHATFTGSREKASVDGAAAAISVDGTTGFAVAAVLPTGTPASGGVGPVSATASQRTRLDEYALRLGGYELQGGSFPVLLSAESFYGRLDQRTSMQADTGGLFDFIGLPRVLTRDADVRAHLFGSQLALETSVPIGSTPWTLIGRASAGAYHVRATGEFSDNFGLANVSSRDHWIGWRFGAELGARYAVNTSSWFTLSGSLDHLTDVPTAVLPRSAGAAGPTAAVVGTDALTSLRVLGRYTVKFGP